MGNPFDIDWEELKKCHLRRDWRDFAICIGTGLILLPVPKAIAARFHHEAWITRTRHLPLDVRSGRIVKERSITNRQRRKPL